MKRKAIERNIVVVLFVAVFVVFSFAERDSRKLKQLYAHLPKTIQKLAALKAR